MSDLFPTATRLRLLRQAERGELTRVTPAVGEPYVQDRALYRVTVRVDELKAAGWVELDPDAAEYADREHLQGYRLTAAGRTLLDGVS